MKAARQTKIMEIIRSEAIETQEDLSRRLHDFGFETTQATISRDIKELRLNKVLSGNGVYKYAPSGGAQESASNGRLQAIFRESVVSFEAAQNLLVIKTLPGLASAACSALDTLNLPDLMGTIAGDDTALVIFPNSDSAREFITRIREMLQ